MPTLLQHIANHTFSAPIAAVYDAIQSYKPDPDTIFTQAALLCAERISGSQGALGSQLILRYNWGVYDLVVNQSILMASPPHKLRIRNRPLRFIPYNPRERTPPLGSDAPNDPDKHFARTFSESPAPIEFQYDLQDMSGGTALTITVEMRPAKKFGRIARWYWRKKVKSEVNKSFRDIALALGPVS